MTPWRSWASRARARTWPPPSRTAWRWTRPLWRPRSSRRWAAAHSAGRRERSLDTLSLPGIMLAAPPVSLLSTLCARTPVLSVLRCCLCVRSSAGCRPCSRAGCGPELMHWRSHGWVWLWSIMSCTLLTPPAMQRAAARQQTQRGDRMGRAAQLRAARRGARARMIGKKRREYRISTNQGISRRWRPAPTRRSTAVAGWTR